DVDPFTRFEFAGPNVRRLIGWKMCQEKRGREPDWRERRRGDLADPLKIIGMDGQTARREKRLEIQFFFKQKASRIGAIVTDSRKCLICPACQEKAGFFEKFTARGGAAHAERIRGAGFVRREFSAGEGPETAEEAKLSGAQDGEDFARPRP